MKLTEGNISLSSLYLHENIAHNLDAVPILEVQPVRVGNVVVSLEVRNLFNIDGTRPNSRSKTRQKRAVVIVLSNATTGEEVVYGIAHAPIAYDNTSALNPLDREKQRIDDVNCKTKDLSVVTQETLIPEYSEQYDRDGVPSGHLESRRTERYNVDGVYYQRIYVSGFPRRRLGEALEILTYKRPYISQSEQVFIGLVLLRNAASSMKQLHTAGYQHGHVNVHEANFIVDDETLSVHIIDGKYLIDLTRPGYTSQIREFSQNEELEELGQSLMGELKSSLLTYQLPRQRFFAHALERITSLDHLVDLLAQTAAISIHSQQDLFRLASKFNRAVKHRLLEKLGNQQTTAEDIQDIDHAIQEVLIQFPTILLW